MQNISYCYFNLNQPEQALVWLDRVLQQDQSYLAALNLKGKIYKQMGQREEAAVIWLQALSINPDYKPAQYALFEVGERPEPEEPPSELTRQLRQMGPVVKARMIKPQIYRNGNVTLTLDPGVGFVLEDAGNEHNGTIYSSAPFRVAKMDRRDILRFIGVLKLAVRQANLSNSRDMAILAYYQDRTSFNYQLKMTEEGLEYGSDGRLLSDEVPTHLKVRVDSDLESPYGSPFQGYFIYLNQGTRPGIAVLTLGLMAD